MRNARVLPDPVFACPIRSLPSRRCGMVLAWNTTMDSLLYTLNFNGNSRTNNSLHSLPEYRSCVWSPCRRCPSWWPQTRVIRAMKKTCPKECWTCPLRCQGLKKMRVVDDYKGLWNLCTKRNVTIKYYKLTYVVVHPVSFRTWPFSASFRLLEPPPHLCHRG